MIKNQKLWRLLRFCFKRHPSFIKLFIGRIFYTLSIKIMLFCATITFFEELQSQEFLAMIGLQGYIPAMIALYFLAPCIDRFKIKPILITCCITLILLTFLFMYSFLFMHTNLLYPIWNFSGIIIVSNLEIVAFDKLCALYPKNIQRDIAISWNRQAVLVNYFIAPLISGILIIYVSFYDVLAIQIMAILVYLVFIYLNRTKEIPKINCLNPELKNTAVASSAPIGELGNRKLLLYQYLFAISFIWLSLINISMIPFLRLDTPSNIIGVILSCSGLGGILGNWFYFRKLHINRLIIKDHKFIFLLLVMILLLGILDDLFILLGVILLVGGYASAYCYLYAQQKSQEMVNPAVMGKFFMVRNLISAVMTVLVTVSSGYLMHPFFRHIVNFFYTEVTLEETYTVYFVILSFLSFVFYLLVLRQPQRYRKEEEIHEEEPAKSKT